MTTVSAAIFTVTQCTLDSTRGVRDVYNTATAGALMGAFAVGIAKRSIVGALLGAGAFAVVGAAPEM
jgi:hypothetical protein